MLIWRGWGFLTPLLLVLPFLACFVTGMVLMAVLPDRLAALPFLLSVPLGLIAAGVVCWKVGSTLNRDKPYEYASTTWFVRMEHGGIVSLVLSVPVGALCLLIIGMVLWFPAREKPVAGQNAVVGKNGANDGRKSVAGGPADNSGVVKLPEPPFAMPRPGLAESLLDDPGLAKLTSDKLTLFARKAIEDGNPQLAAALQRWAIEKGSDQFYNLACYESLCGNLEPAIYWLQEAALKEGVNVDWSQQDSDLENLRADARWAPVLKFLKQTNDYWSSSGVEDHQLVLPSNYDGEPIPVLVWLHGMGDRAESYVFPELQEIADRERVAFVSASGPEVNGPAKFSWSNDMGTNEARIAAALTKFEDRFKVQPGRIALAGFSQGGQVAGELAAVRPERYCGALIMSPGGFQFTLDAVRSTPLHQQQTVIAVCGAGERPGNVQLTEKYAQWFQTAGASVVHKPYPDVDVHSLVPDFAERLPEWCPKLLGVSEKQ